MVVEERLSEEVGCGERKIATRTRHLASSVGRGVLSSGAILQRRRGWIVEMRRLVSVHSYGRKQHG
jgi:hypothetical protein